ncbi:MAG TPA: hemolysin family protein [Rhodanobacteraceae bacterium]|nr:hemolysin family protein [Rhodanobacteraceae bacterium]
MLAELGVVLALALVNGFFALSEIAVVASRKSRLSQMAQTSSRARVALRLVVAPERTLSTVQVGITLLTLVTGVATGDSIGRVLAAWLATLQLPLLASVAVPLGMVAGVALIAFINIVVGELVPKRAALISPERVATQVAVPMTVLAWLMLPFVWIINTASTLVLKLLGLAGVRRSQVTEEEIRLLVAESAEQGVLDADERNMVNRVLRLGDRNVDSVMTPRTRIVWLDAAAPLEQNLALLRSTPYSCYPVYRGDEREVVGVLEAKRLIDRIGQPQQLDLFRHLARPLYVPATARALDLLEEFRDAETPLALVVDEYGDIDGLVTLNNVLEAVVGRSPAPADGGSQRHPIHRRDDGSYIIDGSLSTDDLRELPGLDSLPGEDEHDFHTVAGMVMAHFGRIPQPGEHFDWRGARFEVLDLDGARIDAVLLTLAEPEDG